MTWGDKFRHHKSICGSPTPMNCIIGDSHFERLSRLCHLSLQAEHLPNFVNLGIGGDKLQNIIWRAQWGGMPTNPHKVILCAGTNNIKSTSTWEAQLIASSIVDFTRYLLKTYPYIQLVVNGPSANERATQEQAGRFHQ